MIRAALLLATLLPVALAAQQRGAPGTPRRPTADPVRAPAVPLPQGARPSTPQDTSRRTAADSARAKPLIDWSPDDSVITALLQRAGYSVVRFEAGSVGFDARTRVMQLTGTDSVRAGVQRDSTVLVARTISYDDSTKLVAARGQTITMRDPSQREDVVGVGEMTYDLERKEGKTRDFRTIATAGEDWAIEAHRAAFATDSTGESNTMYGRDGTITSCLDSLPHYHFQAKELKRVSNSVIAARSVVLHVQGVPVMWLPFIFQDIRTGRRSGILTPRIGFSELVRNSPTYRRTAENLGYYFALTDYIDAQASVDWRSSARATEQDPGWTRLNAEMRYRWLDRFMGGSVAVSRSALSTGSTNLALSWSHNQEFSSRTRFTTNLNYASNTQVQRRTTINPYAAVATIASQLNFVRQQGPFSINVGGSRRQYPGRDQVDQDFPSVNVASKPLTVGEWFVLTPSLAFGTRQSLNLDGAGDFAWRYFDNGGALDSTRLKRDTRSTTLTLGTPFKVFDFQVQSGLRFNETENDFPEVRRIVDPADTSRRIYRVYQKTFKSEADFDISIGLPQFLQGTFNFAPSVSASNVDPRGFLVRTERTAGEWVAQTKRITYGAGISPTVFRLYPGVGRVERLRHAISPTFSWTYSPAATIPQEYLDAFGTESQGYLGTLAQNRLNLSLATNLEAKLRSRSDTGEVPGEKIRLVSLQFTPLVYDFERKRATGRSGFATDRFGYTFRSDLLPGFDVGVDYSLFQGNVLSDTAEFSPYREAIRASFQLDARSTIVRGIARLFGADVGAAPGARTDQQALGGATGGLVSSAGESSGFGATTGTRARGAVQEIPTGQGFQAAFTVSSQRQRPPKGDARIIDYDPSIQCAAFIGLPQYEPCVRNAQLNPVTDNLPGSTTEGGSFIRTPPTTSVGVRTSFNLTPKWAASWSTTYDVERREFASQIVSLQRELHDWRAIFGFTQAPNGNFAFTFFISLKAQPEIKLDYDRQTYRQPTRTSPP